MTRLHLDCNRLLAKVCVPNKQMARVRKRKVRRQCASGIKRLECQKVTSEIKRLTSIYICMWPGSKGRVQERDKEKTEGGSATTQSCRMSRQATTKRQTFKNKNISNEYATGNSISSQIVYSSTRWKSRNKTLNKCCDSKASNTKCSPDWKKYFRLSDE